MKLSQRAALRMMMRQAGHTVDVKDLPRSKYMPHQGEREKARRVRRMEQTCTCHPDDRKGRPCEGKRAFTECFPCE